MIKLKCDWPVVVAVVAIVFVVVVDVFGVIAVVKAEIWLYKATAF